MDAILGLLAGCAIGALLGYLFARAKAAAAEGGLREELARLNGRLAELEPAKRAAEEELAGARKQLETLGNEASALKARGEAIEASKAELEGRYEAWKAEIQTVFEARFGKLSQASLEASNKSFLDLSAERLGTLVKPLKEGIDVFNERGKSMEEQLRTLYQHTSSLGRALGNARTRGDWGESVLIQLLERAGLEPGINFEVQQHTAIEDGPSLRPDVTVHLAGGGALIIDAKTPLDAYWEGAESEDEAQRAKSYKRHAEQVKGHVNQLASKEYASKLGGAVDLVMMFLPTEGSYAAAIMADPNLIEYACERRIYLANPLTVLAMMRLVELAWRGRKISDNATRIQAEAKLLCDRLGVFVGHFDGMRKGLERAVGGYNDASRSLETRLVVAANRMMELGVPGERQKEVLQIATSPLALNSATLSLAREQGPGGDGSGGDPEPDRQLEFDGAEASPD